MSEPEQKRIPPLEEIMDKLVDIQRVPDEHQDPIENDKTFAAALYHLLRYTTMKPLELQTQATYQFRPQCTCGKSVTTVVCPIHGGNIV